MNEFSQFFSDYVLGGKDEKEQEERFAQSMAQIQKMADDAKSRSQTTPEERRINQNIEIEGAKKTLPLIQQLNKSLQQSGVEDFSQKQDVRDRSRSRAESEYVDNSLRLSDPFLEESAARRMQDSGNFNKLIDNRAKDEAAMRSLQGRGLDLVGRGQVMDLARSLALGAAILFS